MSQLVDDDEDQVRFSSERTARAKTEIDETLERKSQASPADSGRGTGQDDADDWLMELTSAAGDAAEGPVLMRGEPHSSPPEDSEFELSDTGVLEPEILPDWLSNLKNQEVPKQRKETGPKPRLPEWLKESGELDKPGIQADDSEQPVPQPVGKKSRPPANMGERSKTDSWLVELAAMGTVAADDDQEDETRFVWDDSALASDVGVELGDNAPEWLVELTQSEGWPDKLTESVVSEWLEKREKSPERPADRKPTGTHPLGQTKELSGVPEQLVSHELPGWLEEQEAAPQDLSLREQEEELQEIDLDKELGPSIDLLEDASQEIAQEIDDQFVEAVADQERIMEEHPPEDSEFTPTIEDTLELMLEDLPKLLQRKETVGESIGDAETVEEVHQAIDLKAMESFAEEGHKSSEAVMESDLSQAPAHEQALAGGDSQAEMEPGQEKPGREEVPGWLGVLTGKLLDTFDNEFVSEWFSRDEKIEEASVAEAEALAMEEVQPLTTAPEEPKPEPEPEAEPAPAEIDPFYGQVIPDWVKEGEPEFSEIESPDLTETAAVDRNKKSTAAKTAAAGMLIAEASGKTDVRDELGAEEWLELLDDVDQDEVDTSLGWALERAAEHEAAAGELSPVTVPSKELYLLEDDEIDDELVELVPVGSLIPLVHEPLTEGQFTLTKEQKLQVNLLQQLVEVESKKTRSLAGRSKIGTTTSFRAAVALTLILLILIGWLVPGLIDILPGAGTASVTEYETGVYEAINTAAGRPILVAFEYTPATAGEMDLVANALIQQMAQNNSPVVAVSQSAAGAAVADRILKDFDGLEYFDLGMLPGNALGIRSLALCINGDATCGTIIDQNRPDQAAEMLHGIGLILVLAAERDSLVDWIQQAGTELETEMAAGMIQPLRPLALPYLNSGQLAGAVTGAASASAYQTAFLQGDPESSSSASFALAQLFVIAMLIAGVVYSGASGLMSAKDNSEAKK